MSTDNVTVLQPAAPDGQASGRPYRAIPHNLEAEQALLGALLVNAQAYEKVSEFLQEQHFYSPVHGRIFAAIAKLAERGQEASPVTLKAYFEGDRELEHVGGGAYLAELAANVITVVNAEEYGRTIHEMYLRRALIAIAEEVSADAFTHDLDISARDQIEFAEKKLFDLATTGDFKGGFVALKESLTKAIAMAERAFKTQGHVTGVTTGLSDVDAKLGGLQPSDLLILAGRPSMGKTALATNMAVNAARAHAESGGREGAVVAFFSLEMSSEQLAGRILADMSGVESDRIRRGDIKDSDFQKFVEASYRLSTYPLFIDDTAALTIGAIRTRARRLKRTSGLGMIVVDYLQLISPSGRRASDNRVVEVSEITRGLKAIAKELEVPVLALSQLSRAVEQRDNKRPQLSDLRESGSIEQDADVVMFVYREEYYLSREEPAQKPEESNDRFNERYQKWTERLAEAANLAECIIAKQRHGPIGTVRLFHDPAFTRFSNLDRHYQPQAD